MHLEHVTVVVPDYDLAIEFFVGALGFELLEDSSGLSGHGRPKRWVVVRPPGAATGLLLAQADGADQATVIGNQVADRVGFFLRIDDFDEAFRDMVRAGVEFISEPRYEPYGQVAVFTTLRATVGIYSGPPGRGPAADARDDRFPPSRSCGTPPLQRRGHRRACAGPTPRGDGRDRPDARRVDWAWGCHGQPWFDAVTLSCSMDLGAVSTTRRGWPQPALRASGQSAPPLRSARASLAGPGSVTRR